MRATALIRRTCLALFLACSTPAFAQAQQDYQPESFQPGKDVVWVPTPQVVVDKMLDMARVTPADSVIDLGSGDGRTVITAARRGARAVGVEYNPDMVELSRRNAEKAGVSGRASFVKADLFETDFSAFSVITMFLLPSINLQLRPKILALKPGTRVVSNSFDMAGWEADEIADLSRTGECTVSYCNSLLWIVPARVAGSHKTSAGDLVLEQEFQMLKGTLKAGGKSLPVEGKVRGEEVSFTAGGKAYSGRMNGRRLELQ